MYALNLGPDGRCLSAAPANLAPIGATLVPYLPDGNLYDYRYVNGTYLYEPVSASEPAAGVVSDEVTTADMAAAILEGVNDV